VTAIKRCESCGDHADVRLKDGSTWCMDCHVSALRLGYDTDLGELIDPGSISDFDDVVAESVEWNQRVTS
jgi:hypothetical protein